MRLENSGTQAGAPIKPGFGLDGVEKPSPAMKDFDFEPRANGQWPRTKSQEPNDSMLLLLLLILFLILFLPIANCQLLFASCQLQLLF